MLQCVAVCYSVLQCIAVCCRERDRAPPPVSPRRTCRPNVAHGTLRVPPPFDFSHAFCMVSSSICLMAGRGRSRMRPFFGKTNDQKRKKEQESGKTTEKKREKERESGKRGSVLYRVAKIRKNTYLYGLFCVKEPYN